MGNNVDEIIGMKFLGPKNDLGIDATDLGSVNSPDSLSISSTPTKGYGVTSANDSYHPVDYSFVGETTNG